MQTTLQIAIPAQNRKAQTMKRTLGIATLIAALAIQAVGTAHAATTWTNGNGTGLWSEPGNWSSSPAAPDLDRVFNDTAAGASTVDGNNVFRHLTVATTTGTVNTFDLAGTNTLTNSPAYSTTIYSIGYANAGTSLDSELIIQNGSINRTSASSTNIGYSTGNSATATGSLTLASNLTVTDFQAGGFYVGYQSSSTAGNVSGTFDASAVDGGSFTSGTMRAATVYAAAGTSATAAISFGSNWDLTHTNEFRFGGIVVTGDTVTATYSAGAGSTFNGSGITHFRIAGGAAATTSMNASLNLAAVDNGTLATTSEFLVGQFANSTGTVQLGDSWTLNINGSIPSIGDGGTGSLTSSNLTMTVSGTSRFYVGANGGQGTFDFSDGAIGSGGFTTGHLWVGYGTGSVGDFRMPTGIATITAASQVGSVSEIDGSSGLLELHGTDFVVASPSGVLNINNSGRVNVFIGDNSSGLVLRNTATGALNIVDTVANGNGLLITFESDPAPGAKPYTLGTALDYDAILYGLIWEGIDRTSVLNTYVGNGRLAVADSAMDSAFQGNWSVFYDGTDTYLGYYLKEIPEPASLTLLALAGVLTMTRRRKSRVCRTDGGRLPSGV